MLPGQRSRYSGYSVPLWYGEIQCHNLVELITHNCHVVNWNITNCIWFGPVTVAMVTAEHLGSFECRWDVWQSKTNDRAISRQFSVRHSRSRRVVTWDRWFRGPHHWACWRRFAGDEMTTAAGRGGPVGQCEIHHSLRTPSKAVLILWQVDEPVPPRWDKIESFQWWAPRRQDHHSMSLCCRLGLDIHRLFGSSNQSGIWDRAGKLRILSAAVRATFTDGRRIKAIPINPFRRNLNQSTPSDSARCNIPPHTLGW